eukprot:gnl/TRDRNA2_/TRDRNA2_162454_c0_seq1.p1 gnl/TRDRNA2_/TRDRNA2_162454_c0~~gnl/TRDRNA2_/TRDRNA2_162454_c0_seq1.p1  ORF type:complete len:210 (-),score=18.37 gnl/TRDRNA2_/TRDRNA2_162454_c0_seq1:53-682(-)
MYNIERAVEDLRDATCQATAHKGSHASNGSVLGSPAHKYFIQRKPQAISQRATTGHDPPATEEVDNAVVSDNVPCDQEFCREHASARWLAVDLRAAFSTLDRCVHEARQETTDRSTCERFCGATVDPRRNAAELSRRSVVCTSLAIAAVVTADKPEVDCKRSTNVSNGCVTRVPPAPAMHPARKSSKTLRCGMPSICGRGRPVLKPPPP